MRPADTIGRTGANYQATAPSPLGCVRNRPGTRDEKHITEHTHVQPVTTAVGFTAKTPAPVTIVAHAAAATGIEHRGRR